MMCHQIMEILSRNKQSIHGSFKYTQEKITLSLQHDRAVLGSWKTTTTFEVQGHVPIVHVWVRLGSSCHKFP